MISQPLVSVIMTAFNREQFIAEAIESVLASGYKNLELLVFDDRSADNTVRVVRRYLHDERVQLYINEKNLGDYPNRNFAVRHAKGKYIMFCDSDDHFFKDTLGYCADAMEANPDAKLGMYYAGSSGPPFLLSSEAALQQHFFSSPFLVMGPGGTIIERAFFNEIGGYPEKYGPANDMYFNLKAASKTSLLLLPTLFLHYREHEGQEKNNLYAYVHYNYRYMADALKELDMGLSVKQYDYLRKKNNRRFVVNLLDQVKEKKSIAVVKDLWRKAGFDMKGFVSGIFH